MVYGGISEKALKKAREYVDSRGEGSLFAKGARKDETHKWLEANKHYGWKVEEFRRFAFNHQYIRRKKRAAEAETTQASKKPKISATQKVEPNTNDSDEETQSPPQHPTSPTAATTAVAASPPETSPATAAVPTAAVPAAAVSPSAAATSASVAISAAASAVAPPGQGANGGPARQNPPISKPLSLLLRTPVDEEWKEFDKKYKAVNEELQIAKTKKADLLKQLKEEQTQFRSADLAVKAKLMERDQKLLSREQTEIAEIMKKIEELRKKRMERTKNTIPVALIPSAAPTTSVSPSPR